VPRLSELSIFSFLSQNSFGDNCIFCYVPSVRFWVCLGIYQAKLHVRPFFIYDCYCIPCIQHSARQAMICRPLCILNESSVLIFSWTTFDATRVVLLFTTQQFSARKPQTTLYIRHCAMYFKRVFDWRNIVHNLSIKAIDGQHHCAIVNVAQ
jgi:hypothetical protein